MSGMYDNGSVGNAGSVGRLKLNRSTGLKERLGSGETLVGTWCIIPSAYTINIMAKAGLDFVIIDMEHGAMDFEKTADMVVAAEAEGCHAIVRVPKNDEVSVLRALELGVDGIVAPHIENEKQAREFVSYMKYPPKGVRGFSPYTRAGAYHSDKNHTKMQNEKTFSIALVEGPDGIKNIERIAALEDIDAVYVGTYDISSSLGIAGDVKNEKVTAILKECVKKIRKTGKVAAGMAHNEKEIADLKGMGVQLILYSVDTLELYNSYNRLASIKRM